MATKRGPVAPTTNGHRLTKAELLEQMSEQRETFTLPGGGTIVLRSLGTREGVEHFGTTTTDSQTIAERTRKICLLGIVEPPLEPEDLEALETARFGALNQIATKILELTGIVGDGAANFLTPIPTSKA